MAFPFSVGDTRQIEVDVSPADVRRFAELSGDHAPLHTDPLFAAEHGFKACVVHGAFLASVVSRLVGMQLPGPLAVLERMDLAFHAPCYAPCRLLVSARVRHLSEAVNSISLDVTIGIEHGPVLAIGKTWHKLLSGSSQ